MYAVCDGLPVDNRSTSSGHHGPDPASGIQQGQLQTCTTLCIQISYVGLLQVTRQSGEYQTVVSKCTRMEKWTDQSLYI